MDRLNLDIESRGPVVGGETGSGREVSRVSFPELLYNFVAQLDTRLITPPAGVLCPPTPASSLRRVSSGSRIIFSSSPICSSLRPVLTLLLHSVFRSPVRLRRETRRNSTEPWYLDENS